LDRESPGLIPTAAWKKKRFKVSWQGGETLSVAIGQGYNLVTPLQMARFTAAFANGGILYKPQIIESIRDHSQTVIHESKPKVMGKLPAGKETMAIVREGLWEVVNGAKGTARSVRLDSVEVIGKTGTAQVVGRRAGMPPGEADRFLHLKAHAWFVAYAPASDPEIAIAVLVENGEHGSSVAPIARELIRTYRSSSALDTNAPFSAQSVKLGSPNDSKRQSSDPGRHLADSD
jgi:penicillin-binding protein 2